MRIAVIGSGISGMAAAYYLSRKHEVFLFEKDTRPGGHTHTVTVESGRGPVAVDTGFIVHNDRNYPNLVRLFAELGVATQRSDMSFAVADRVSGFEYSSRGLNGYFAQRSNLLRADHYRLLQQILRFNREAAKAICDPANEGLTLGQFIDKYGYSEIFTERYLFPMACAVWSMSGEAIRQFPALTLLRFFENHGMLGINTHPQWKVVCGGSQSYIAPLTGPYKDNIYTGVEIKSVIRSEGGVRLRFADRAEMSFDYVVFSCHGDQVLPLLQQPSDTERSVLSKFTTSRNEVCLHTDANLLARRASARASWNYNLATDRAKGATLTYDMNRLQSLAGPEQYCVTLNGTESIEPSKILREMVYYHPIYNRDAVRAQARWSEINGENRTHFCGAYWFYGFHEDGLNSALRVARAFGVEC